MLGKSIKQRSPFKHQRFPPDVILRVARWVCQYALWGRKLGPEIAKKTSNHQS
jgi:hypothetical protein